MRRKITIRYILSKIWYRVWGGIFSVVLYKKEFRQGDAFKGKFFAVNSIVWELIVQDMKGRVFLNRNRGIPYLCSPLTKIVNYKNIHFDESDSNIFLAEGAYFQALDSQIYIGKGCYIAPNVGLITSNHDLYELDKRGKKGDIILGKECWIGMNSIVLPGVALGEHTVVGAGSVVTKSFPDGHCVIVGNPARIIKQL